MGSITGHSAGFGRIGPETRSSMFTPYQLRSVASDEARSAARHRETVRKRLVTGALLVAGIAAAALAAGWLVQGRPVPVPSPLEAAQPKAPPLDAEAERLGRSAFARQRNRG